MITPHCLKRIKEREINVDLEMVEYLCKKSTVSTAFILGKITFLGEINYVILVVREGDAVTLELRRATQTISIDALKVGLIVEYPCLF